MNTQLTCDEWCRKLVLGTVQFGLDYGISNQTGKVSLSEALSILKLAAKSGIHILDTASAYGTSEEVIGKLLISENLDFEVVTKFKPNTTADSLIDGLKMSFSRLHTDFVYGFLAHQFGDFKDKSLRDALEILKMEQFSRRIGVSVYYPEEVEWLLMNNIAIDLIQLPFNILDQRFQDYLPDLKKRHVEIHVRSVFLQGLFFLPIDQLSEHFKPARKIINKIADIASKISVPLGALLLNFAILNPLIDNVVIGVTTEKELRMNLDSYNYLEQCSLVYEQLKSLSIDDESILLPFNWS